MDVRVVAAYASLYDTTTNILNRGNNVGVMGGGMNWQVRKPVIFLARVQ